MDRFIKVTNLSDRSIFIKVKNISIIEQNMEMNEITGKLIFYTTIRVDFPNNETQNYYVKETCEDILKAIEDATKAV